MIGALTLLRSSRRFRAAALVLLCIGALAASLAPYQGLIAVRHFGFSDAGFAWISMTGAAASVAVALYVGILSDQWGARRAIAITTAAIGTAGLAAVWITGHPWAYLVSALITNPIGFSLMGQMYAVARLSCADHPQETREGAMAAIRAGFALPFIVILPLWSLAFERDVSLIHIYAATALAGLGCLLSVLFILPRDGAEGAAEARSGLSLRAALAELTHWRVSSRLFLVATVISANTIYMYTMGLLFENVHPEGTARTARFAALVAGLEIPFMMLIPMLTRRAGKSGALLVAAVVYAGFLLAFPALAATGAVWPLAIVAAAGAGVLLTVPIAYFQDLLPGRPGASSSLQSVNQVSAQIIAGSVFWIGTSLGGYATVMYIAAGLAVLAGLLLVRADRAAP